jgi:hypothetical protein
MIKSRCHRENVYTCEIECESFYVCSFCSKPCDTLYVDYHKEIGNDTGREAEIEGLIDPA